MADPVVDVPAENFSAGLNEMINKLKNSAGSGQAASPTGRNGYNCCQLRVAGLGGRLYGVEAGIIAGVPPYLEATFNAAAAGQTLNAGQLSFIVAAVLPGSVIARWFAGRWAGKLKRTDYYYWAGANQPDGRQFWN
jgi:hypothetical protein